MKLNTLFYFPAVAFLIFALMQVGRDEPLIWICAYSYSAIISALAALNKLHYTLVLIGFLAYFFLLTFYFPPIEKLTLMHQEGIDAVGLIVCGNWSAILGIHKLYRDNY